MEQEHKDITDRQIYETSIGPVCMSKTEYTMYQEEMAKRTYLCRFMWMQMPARWWT
mgnify:CR=1 FL=1